MKRHSIDSTAENEEGVRVWRDDVVMPTYEPAAPDRNPMFIERRVYQGSSGRVYPLPVIDRIATLPQPRAWQAIHLENEFLQLMVLPELGGRIHAGLDKTNGYDFFYRQEVIKPALVGLAGPWISGGVEFNWPQHHRPATFMPVEVEIERDADGSVTVWCSDVDPISHMKGMHGVCLRPGSAVLELKVRLYNRTPQTQTFLWWANAATKVHEQYQSFFPSDVHHVADHAKRAITSFPLSDRPYYGVDYAGRARDGVPADELPARFLPDGSYAANDLSWYANIPVPTSYMITGTKQDFFGGYDHRAKAGVVHVANRHMAPGKKQWTWGNHEFGYAWDRSLSDDEAPYIELMAGVFTDNQPDFSFLGPWERRTFTQYWYPIREIGVPGAANTEAAISVRCEGGEVAVGVCVTADLSDAEVLLLAGGRVVERWEADVSVAKPLLVAATVEGDVSALSVSLRCGGREILAWLPPSTGAVDEPAAATEPLPPAEIAGNEELYLTGLHLEQYRHATRDPMPYWREALRRDAGDSRVNTAVARWHMRSGEFAAAERHLRVAVARLTERNPNPADGEPLYQLGLVLRWLGRDEEAYEAIYKATWNAGWQAAAYFALAQIDVSAGRDGAALEHLRKALEMNTGNLHARNLLTEVMRRCGVENEAEAMLSGTLALDPLDAWARWLRDGSVPAANQQVLDLAFDLRRCGLGEVSLAVLRLADLGSLDGSVPIVLYATARAVRDAGGVEDSEPLYDQAAAYPSDYCFPNRMDEMVLLEEIARERPQDAACAYYLGCMLYDLRRHEDAMVLWEASARLRPAFPTVWRNLGLARFNVAKDAAGALEAFERAFAADSSDARLLYERDQLWKRTGRGARGRLAELERYRALVGRRDDLSLEFATLLNQLDRPDEALAEIVGRKFQPWEGGEGLVLAQFVQAHLQLGRRALASDPAGALVHFAATLHPPQSLSEAWHLLANQSEVYFYIGEAYAALGDADGANAAWRRAAYQKGDFQQMAVRTVSEMTYWSALAFRRLGAEAGAQELIAQMQAFADELERTPAVIDYFATSLPTMLLFEEDLAVRRSVESKFLRAQAAVLLGKTVVAAAQVHAILRLDPNHMAAMGLQQQLQQEVR